MLIHSEGINGQRRGEEGERTEEEMERYPRQADAVFSL